MSTRSSTLCLADKRLGCLLIYARLHLFLFCRLSDDDPEEVRKAAETGDKLPPISNIEEIFADLTSRADGLKELVDSLDGKPLKIATMCSGTESPILALGLIAEALWVKYGVELKFKHDFSCEIEPYKQAYIERNFSPRTSSDCCRSARTSS